jgi:DNA polymerase
MLPLDDVVGTPKERSAQFERVRAEAADCRACPLWEIGTQTVFGEGPVTARLMLVGEAPGYQEDQSGRPFVGPAGKLLDEALAAAGLRREQLYVTNAVKHRPWTAGGAHGKNRPPKQSEVNACRPWLSAELRLVRPSLVCCLGAVAAKALLGKTFRLTQQRGEWQQTDAGFLALATVHPSFVLIQPAESHERWRETFFDDLRAVADRYRELQAGR